MSVCVAHIGWTFRVECWLRSCRTRFLGVVPLEVTDTSSIMAKASPIRESNQSSPSRAYNEALTKQILSLSHGYRHRWRRHEPTRAEHDPARTKGDLIRERIAANAQRRFSAAEAMKLEAGVQGHDINGEKHGGIAFSATGKILAPAGETLAQLATLAHECGHVFLHRTGTPGGSAPSRGVGAPS